MTITASVLTVFAICFVIAIGYTIYNKLPNDEPVEEEMPRDDKVTWWPDDK